MELYIDNIPVEIESSSAASVTLSLAAVTDPEHARAGYTRTLRIPMSAAADAVMGHAGDIHSTDHFNAAAHTGRIEHEGVVLIEGPLYLTAAVNSSEQGGYYEVYIVGGSKEWAIGAAGRSLRQTGIAYTKPLQGANIADSWVNSEPVKYFPVARARVEKDYSSGSAIPVRRVLSIDDYHPFVQCSALMRGIFADHGYTLDSEFLQSDEFQSLYASGNYPMRDATRLMERMDFLARRKTETTVPAGGDGRVYADPYRTAFSIGNLVEAPPAGQSAADGSVTGDAFSRGGCFTMDDKRLAFVPTEEVEMGFAYNLKYRTAARIKNRTEMVGFDEIYLGEQTSRKVTLVNPWPDRRKLIRKGVKYNVCIFDYVPGTKYRLEFISTNDAGDFALESGHSQSFTRFTQLILLTGGDDTLARDIVMLYRTSDTAPWVPYPGDWAIYDGFVTESCTMDVEMTIRTKPETVAPGRPKFFDRIWLGGAQTAMSFTMKAGTSIRPVFYGQPAENQIVSFADVFAHDATQMDFLMAMRQMFNLIFRTDKRSRKVFVEPARSFYIAENPLMWTSRIDNSKPIRVEELGGEVAKQMTWSYRTGDGAVSRFNRNGGGHLGQWSVAVENAAASKTSRVWENPLFTASVTALDVVGGAPSAALVEAGDGNFEAGIDSLNFPPKIVRYEGLKPLPMGEAWSWPLVATTYPKIAFHAPESGYTLCFEDRDGCTGLNRNWKGDVRLWNSSRRVTLHLTLSAVEIENIDFRRLVSLTIDGETALYRLEEIADFNPQNRSTKCIFIKHIF